MSIGRLQNQWALQSDLAASRIATTRMGTISSVDSANYAAKVLFQPDGTESGWLPISSPWVGNGWGMFSPPSPGQAVTVHFQEGVHEAGIITLGNFNDVERPLNVPAGEFWLVHASGATLKFHNDGTVNMTSPGVVTMSATTWNITGNMNLTGNLLVTGDISDQNAANGTVQHIRATYDIHTHPAPGGTTSPPNQPL